MIIGLWLIWLVKHFKQNKVNGKLFPPWFNIHDIPNRPELSDAYTVYVIGVGHGDKTDAHESHWSYEYGIAVNLQKSEVIYWINARAD